MKPTNLADVVHALEDVRKLPTRTKADLQSAVRSFCRVCGLDPGATSASNLAALQAARAAATPQRFGVSAQRWSVICSQLVRTLILTGAATPLQTATIKLSASWAALLAAAPHIRQRHALSRFARYCSKLGIDPGEVTPTNFEAFREDLTTNSLVRNAEEVYRTTARTWSVLLKGVASFARIRIEDPPSKADLTQGRHPITSFPQSFQDDLAAFKRWCVTADPLDDSARPKALRSQTVISYCSNLHTAADATVRAGIPAEDITTIGALATPDMYIKILRQLLADHDQKPSPTLDAVATMVPIVAKDWLKQSPEQIAELKKIKAKLPKLKPGLTQKNRDLLAAFDDESLLRKFLFLPDRLWDEALYCELPSHQRLVTAQMSLLIGIQQIVALRRRNICHLVFDRHITWPNGPKAAALIQVPASEMKTSVDYLGELPIELSRRLHYYRTKLAPAIIGSVPDHLFVKTDGHPKRQESVVNRLVVTLGKRLGLHMTGHQLRHLAAKLMLDRYPGAFETVAQTLGHTGTKNVVRFYAGVDTRRATRHHAKLIEDLRDQKKTPDRKAVKVRARKAGTS